MKRRRRDIDAQSETGSTSYEDELKAVNQQLKAANQQLRANEQQLQAANQQLKAHQQQLRAQQQQLRAANQQLRANEQQLKAANQQLRANEQQLRSANKRLEESERMLEQTNRLARTGGWEHDLVANKAIWTKSLFDLLELDPDALIPGPSEYMHHYPDKDRELVQKAYKHAIETGEAAELEARRFTARGNLRWWHIYGEPVFENGKCVRMRGIFQDITDRKEAELALQRSQRQLAEAQRIAGWGSWEQSLDNDYVMPSREMLNISGEDPGRTKIPVDEAIKVVHPDDRDKLKSTLETVLKTGRSQSLEYRIIRPRDGDIVILSAEVDLIRDESGNPERLIGTCRDITRERRVQEEIRAIYETSVDMMCVADLATATFTRVNPAWTHVLGYTAEELLSRPFIEFVHPDDVQPTIDVLEEKVRKGEDIISFENRYRTKSGEYRWLEWVSRPDVERGVTFAIAHDVTERKQHEQELRDSERRFRSYVDNSPIGIFVADRDGNYVDVNPAASAITGYSREELLKMNLADWMPVETTEEGRQAFDRLKADRKLQAELPFVTKSGETRYWVVNAVEVDGGLYIGFVDDITETRKLQQLAARAERLETAGTIAGQVAHDFNNLLGPVMAYPELIRDELPHDHPVLPFLADIESAARKMSDINQDLLTMGRRGHYNQEVLDLNQVVMYAVKEIVPKSETLKCNLNLSSDLLRVMGGQAQIHRMLSNLLANARDAMQDIGNIAIRTENFYADNTSIAFGRVPKGEYVKLTISDTGCGIPEEILERVFDPFFTTKSADKKRGSGLGLSVVDAVMRDHGGYLDLKTRVGHGTSFYLYFPVTREVVEDVETAQLLSGTERVLVVDDDRVQREVCRRLLEKLGYQVFVVECGEDAIDAARTHDPDLLILDMVMPDGIDGTETYRRIREIRPDQKAIILSGYSETGRVLEAQKMGAGAFVRKPLTKATLASAVRMELDRR